MNVLLADRLWFYLKFIIKCMVTHELTFCSQYLLFKSLACAQNMIADTLTVDN